MLAKTVEKGGKDWDQKLPFVLFAYRASQQQSTMESPFFLLYGRDPRLPTEPVMSPVKTKKIADLREYGVELASSMSEAWELARHCIGKAQKRQKEYYDQRGRLPNFRVGERVFLFKPADKTGEAKKFARPYHGPFRIIDLDVNTARIRRVDKPEEEAILVALNRLRRCPSEVSDEFWPPDKQKKRGKSTTKSRLSNSFNANSGLEVSGGTSTASGVAHEMSDSDCAVSETALSDDVDGNNPTSEESATSNEACGVEGVSDAQMIENTGEETQTGRTPDSNIGGSVCEESQNVPQSQGEPTSPKVTQRSKWAGRLRRNRQERVVSAVGV